MLREHQQRRRGLKTSYNEMTNAVENMGGAMALDDEENEVDFALPPDEHTYSSYAQHPPRMWTDSGPGSLAKRRLAKKTSAESKQMEVKPGRGRKRSLDPRDAVGGGGHPSQTRKKQLTVSYEDPQRPTAPTAPTRTPPPPTDLHHLTTLLRHTISRDRSRRRS